MANFKVETYLYVADDYIVESGVEPMKRDLQSHGWTVVNFIWAELGSGFANAFGKLAEAHPVTIIIERPAGSKEQAEEDVNAAIRRTGNYSVVAGVSSVVAQIGGGLGESFDPDGKESPILETVKLVAFAVLGVAALGLVIYAAPLIRSAADATKAAR